jgi:hypothetical protein
MSATMVEVSLSRYAKACQLRRKQEAKAVTISYHDLFNRPETLIDDIARAFGSEPDCLGLIVVNDLPERYVTLRENLLYLADKFAGLDESVRERYSDPSTHYSFGWSHGKVCNQKALS